MASNKVITLGVLGDPGHGKTTLSNALRKVANEVFGALESSSALSAKQKEWHAIDESPDVWKSTLRSYMTVKCPWGTKALEAMSSAGKRFDAIILVVWDPSLRTNTGRCADHR